MNFHCSYSGESLDGVSSTTCQSDSTWSNPTPSRCKYIILNIFQEGGTPLFLAFSKSLNYRTINDE